MPVIYWHSSLFYITIFAISVTHSVRLTQGTLQDIPSSIRHGHNVSYDDLIWNSISDQPSSLMSDQLPMKRYQSKSSQDDDSRVYDIYTLEEDKLREDDSRPIVVLNDYRGKPNEDLINSVVPDSIGTVDDEVPNADVTFVRRSQFAPNKDTVLAGLGLNGDDVYVYTPHQENRANAVVDSVEEMDVSPVAIGHKFIQGGAGEGIQFLGPNGKLHNVQVVKSDKGLAEYCNPPNPCPLGYTEKDNCIQQFENSAEFSRNYQRAQNCPCDVEHSLTNCNSQSKSGDLINALAQAVQNRIGLLDLPDVKKRVWQDFVRN